MKLEKDDYVITYQNTEDGAPVSNFNDTLMVYMVKYGTGQAGFVMDEEGKKNLKKVFDEMNYYDSSSSTAQIPAGASLGEVVTTGYCSCPSAAVSGREVIRHRNGSKRKSHACPWMPTARKCDGNKDCNEWSYL